MLDVLEMYPEFAEEFVKNLEVTFDLRDVSTVMGKLYSHIVASAYISQPLISNPPFHFNRKFQIN